MVTIEAIDAALAAHAEWKERLLTATSSGTSEFSPAIVRKDDACQFGKWLYSLSSQDQQSEHFRTVQSLHAQFHEVAGGILALALSGKTEEAKKKLEFGSEYGSAAGKLVLALRNWKNSF